MEKTQIQHLLSAQQISKKEKREMDKSPQTLLGHELEGKFRAKYSERIVHALRHHAPWDMETQERFKSFTQLLKDFENKEGSLYELITHAPKEFSSKEIFRDYLEKVTRDPAFFRSLLECSSTLVCMDGGIHGVHLRAEGGGILSPRDGTHIRLPNVYPYTELHTIISSLRQKYPKFSFNLLSDASTATHNLLPEKKQMEHLRDLVGKGIVTRIDAHADCGAAKVDLMRIVHDQLALLPFEEIKTCAESLGYVQQEQERVRYEDFILKQIMQLVPKKVVNSHAELWAKTLAEELHIPHGYIEEDQLVRNQGKHMEEAIYLDAIGGTHRGIAFNPELLKLPNGFVYQSHMTSWKAMLEKIPIALSIAFGENGPGKNFFTTQRPFQIVLLTHPLERAREMEKRKCTEKEYSEYQRMIIENAVPVEYRDRVDIQVVTPEIERPGSFDTVLDFAKKELEKISRDH